MEVNFYNHVDISGTFESEVSLFFSVLSNQGISATGFKRTQGNQHCKKFESHTNRVTFETNTIMMIVKVHPLCTHYSVPQNPF